MGMSASQARLIALTGRMNDIEYQGQQINQQRTTLSNQINSLYNQLLDMSVPTPPSTSDYTKVQYSGTADASKFTLGNVIPTGKNELGDNTYTVQFSYNRAGHSVSKNTNSATLTKTTEYAGFNSASKVLTTQGLIENETLYTKNVDEKITEKPADSNKEVLVEVDASTYKTWSASHKTSEIGVYGQDGKDCKSSLPTSGKVYVMCKASQLDSLGGDNGLISTNADTGAYQNVYGANTTTEQSYPTSFDDSKIASMNLYYCENENSTPVQITTFADFKKYVGEDFSGTDKVYTMATNGNGEKTFKNPNYVEGETNYSVGNMPVYDMSDETIIAKLSSTSYDEYMTALRNAFPSEYTSDMSNEDIAKDFYVYIENSNGTNIPHFIKKSEMSSLNPDAEAVRTYDYDEDGTYTQVENKENCQLEFDVSTGRITKVGITNNGQVSWITLTAETVTDETAYNEAFNNYEYDKATYDKTQQDINAKTSIVQQEDKNLELKLTRLDNERNAVNTEIEAVKKVVSDNIEKSYKTFSG